MNANSRNFEAELTAIGLEAKEAQEERITPRRPVDSIPIRKVK